MAWEDSRGQEGHILRPSGSVGILYLMRNSEGKQTVKWRSSLWELRIMTGDVCREGWGVAHWQSMYLAWTGQRAYPQHQSH